MVYSFGHDECTVDIALLILENSITDENTSYFIDFDKLEKCDLLQGEYFFVGYGMNNIGARIEDWREMDKRIEQASYFDKYIGGWNAKKKTGPYAFQGFYTVDGYLFFEELKTLLPESKKRQYIAYVPTDFLYGGGSYSGSPIIVENERNKYSIVGIFTGTENYSIYDFKYYIKAVGEHYKKYDNKKTVSFRKSLVFHMVCCPNDIELGLALRKVLCNVVIRISFTQ